MRIQLSDHFTYGEGDKDKANRYFSLFVYVAFAIGVILALTGIV